ncbi:hypothetical protein RND81_14G172700 [Saponaria officinalis]|uniref:KIB1-4 beta-propeller domain-containing protein n=1 Tax=Saponaria officinalis TaxID=3572 RepID=A0AAW1GRA5_SAPOF
MSTVPTHCMDTSNEVSHQKIEKKEKHESKRMGQQCNTHISELTCRKIIAQKAYRFKNPKPIRGQFDDPIFTDHRYLAIQTTDIHHISSVDYTHRDSPWIIAAVDDDTDNPPLLHPLTLKHHRYNLPQNFDLFHPKFRNDFLSSFLSTEFSFDKLVVPVPRSKIMSDNTMLVLYGGGNLIGRPFLIDEEQSTPWVKLSEDRFDDIIVISNGKDQKICALDRLGRLFFIKINITSRVLRLGRAVVTQPVELGPGRVGWRKRLVVGKKDMFTVVRVEEKVFRVYKFIRNYESEHWAVVKWFYGNGDVLFISKDCCFFVGGLLGEEYKNCIVFSEAGFPKYGDDGGWEYKCEDEIWAFRLTDGLYGKVGESDDFPEIDWSPPSWISVEFEIPL